jgi:hypothetical protein
VVVPILADNYAYLIVDEATKTCLAVDPSGVFPFLIASFGSIDKLFSAHGLRFFST